MSSKNFFFSYARVDIDFATKIANDLIAEGVDLWVDHINIKKGKNWDTEVENALNEAKCLLVLLSPKSVASDNVLNEIAAVLEDNKEVIPLLIENCKPPLNLRRRQRVDFTGDYNAALNDLLETLGFPVRNSSKVTEPIIAEPVIEKPSAKKLTIEEQKFEDAQEKIRRTFKFEKDIYISYVHIDDEPLDVGTIGWVTDFHKVLEVRLSQVLGYKANIWRVAQLSGNSDFALDIKEILPKVKIMISIITPRYIKSDFCRKEFETFIKETEKTGGWIIGNKSRVFAVYKTPVDRSELPVELAQILGYEFYSIDKDLRRIKEFDRNRGEESSKMAYYDKLEDLVYGIADMLKLFEEK